MAFEYDQEVVSQIAGRCTEVESGARNIDHIIAKHLNPILASAILRRMGEGQMSAKAKVVFAADKGVFDAQFSGELRKAR